MAHRVIAVAVMASVLVGCGANSDDSGEGDSDSSGQVSPEFVDDATAPTFEPADGPLLIKCEVADPAGPEEIFEMDVSLRQLNLEDGSAPEVFAATLPDGFDSDVNVCRRFQHLQNYAAERYFDPAFQRLAVSWHDDGYRVGWVTNTGTLVDVTDRVPTDGGDLRAAQFDSEGHFVYVDHVDFETALLHRIDVSDLSEVGTGEPQAVNSTIDRKFLLPDDSTESVSTLKDSLAKVEVTTPSGQTYVSDSDGWVVDLIGDDSVLLKELDGDTHYSLYAVSPANATAAIDDLPLLVNLPHAALDDAVSGGDGTLVVYAASGYDETDTGLFVVPVDGSDTPRRFGDYVSGYRLLIWPDA